MKFGRGINYPVNACIVTSSPSTPAQPGGILQNFCCRQTGVFDFAAENNSCFTGLLLGSRLNFDASREQVEAAQCGAATDAR
jgi:hypothetical protein